jgi:hypothetical protein
MVLTPVLAPVRARSLPIPKGEHAPLTLLGLGIGTAALLLFATAPAVLQ